jgi:thiamine thiazole synthase
MSPPVALGPNEPEFSTLKLKADLNATNGAHKTNGANGHADADVNEDYAGDYRFAPIEEAQVSRAMIKRYFSFLFYSSRIY